MADLRRIVRSSPFWPGDALRGRGKSSRLRQFDFHGRSKTAHTRATGHSVWGAQVFIIVSIRRFEESTRVVLMEIVHRARNCGLEGPNGFCAVVAISLLCFSRPDR